MDNVISKINEVNLNDGLVVEIKGDVDQVSKDSGLESNSNLSNNSSKGLKDLIIPFQALNKCIDESKDGDKIVLQSSVMVESQATKETNWSTIQGSANDGRGN